MNIFDINPYIRLSMHSTILAPTRINTRVLLDYELIYIEEGEFVLTYNHQDFKCKRGDFLLICPGVSHSFHVFTTNLVQPHIHFDLKYDLYSEHVFICYKDAGDLTPREQAMMRENIYPHRKTSPFIKVEDAPAFLKVFYSIIDTDTSRPLLLLKQKGEMIRLLQMIFEANPPKSLTSFSDNIEITLLIKNFIDANYDQNIQLSSLEHQFGYSRFYIEKLFKSKYGTSIISYRNAKRLETAVQLLKTHSVTETAQILGFSSIYTFSRAFRAVYGESPSRYTGG